MWTHGLAGVPPFPVFPPFPFFPLIPLALLCLVAFLIYRRGHWGRFDQAMVVLRERYARGEIDAEEYQARKDALRNH